MPGKINRVPDGVLGFLGIKNFGRMPDDLSPTLAGTWDLQQWYLNANVSYQQSSLNNIAAPGPTVVFTVPNNEIWWVSNFSLYTNTGLASTNKCIMVRYGQRTADYVAMGDVSDVPIAGGANHVSIDTPFILGAGESLGFTCILLTGVNNNSQLFVRYRPMQV